MFTEIVEETRKIQTITNKNSKNLKKSDLVNIEVDILAKYIEKFLSTSDNRSRIDLDFLQRNGFY